MSDFETPDPSPQDPWASPASPRSATPPTADGSSVGGTPFPAPAAADEPAPKGWKQWAVAGVAAAVVAVAVGAGIGLASNKNDSQNTAAAAAGAGAGQGNAAGGYGGMGQGGPGGPGGLGGQGTFGTISAVDGTTITLAATDRQSGTTSTVTVKTTGKTTVSETVKGSVSDLATGDNVMVMGTTADGVVTAQRVTDTGDQAFTFAGRGGGAPPAGSGEMPSGTPPAGAGGQGPGGQGPGGQGPGGGQFPGGGDFTPPTTGTITSIDGSTITVKTSDGSVKVEIGSDATISVVKTIKVSDLAKGDSISVQGDTSGTTVTATSIRKGEMGGGFGR